ncbi:RNA-directed DNA polymerase, eukaryota [Tanacetum coccineum]
MSCLGSWVKDKRLQQIGGCKSIKDELIAIDKDLDSGNASDELLLRRMELMRQYKDMKQIESKEFIQKAKIKWAIEGDKNSKFFHFIINKKRSQLSVRGVFVDGDWKTDQAVVKDAFKDHFASRFKRPERDGLKLNSPFPNRLSTDQVDDLDRGITRDEIRDVIWCCGVNKSPGPDGFTFEFFRRYWSFIGPDFCSAVKCFFENGSFSKGCNSSFITLIPKVIDAKFVTDYRPISLIGCVYKVVTKILANRLALVIKDLVSDTQSAFVANRQILDGPFILNEILTPGAKDKRSKPFGFGPNWCKWIRGIFSSAMASVLVNGSPSSEFPFFCGLKQGDPLASFLFILVMESLHISMSRAINDGVFRGLQLHGSMCISHLFYADDDVFIGECHLLGVGVPRNRVIQCATLIGCETLQSSFKYLGVMVGECMSRFSAWTNTIQKLHSRLSNWKVKTLSIGGRLTLLKSVLGASPLYNMSIYKVPKGVLKEMESIRSKFFNGADPTERKIAWVAWDRILAAKKNGGLGVSSFHALNRALILKWVWRFISQDGSLWYRVIHALYGPSVEHHLVSHPSNWCSVLREMQGLNSKGFNLMSHCKKRIRIRKFLLLQQWTELSLICDSFTLSSAKDRWVCDLNGNGDFRVKEIRKALDDIFLPSAAEATRWVKVVPIKLNVFAWRARIDRLPTRNNLASRGVVLDSDVCPLCGVVPEDIEHVLFRCDTALSLHRRVCSWWDLEQQDVSSFSDWNGWFASIRLSAKIKSILEGVFVVTWWHIWLFRNRSIFGSSPPRRSVLFDDIIMRSFTWISSRCNSSFTWESWLKNP